jgi:hypothetical protein
MLACGNNPPRRYRPCAGVFPGALTSRALGARASPPYSASARTHRSQATHCRATSGRKLLVSLATGAARRDPRPDNSFCVSRKFSAPHPGSQFAGDSPLEGNGFELPVRERGESGCRRFCAVRLLGTGRCGGAGAAVQQQVSVSALIDAKARATFWVDRWAIRRSGRARSPSRIISASAMGGSAISLLICSPTPKSGLRSTISIGERHEPGRAFRPHRAEGPFRRSREARLAGARTGDGVRGWDDAARGATSCGNERQLVEFPPRQIDLSAEGGQMLG